MSQPNLITNVDAPARDKRSPAIQPMWDADGLLQPTQPDEPLIGSIYHRGPVPQYQNGLVAGISGMPGNGFPLFTCDNNTENTFKDYALYGIQTRSPLSDTFFSDVNMKRIQDQLRYRVWTASGGKYQIGDQSTTELMVIMRAIFLQNGKFLDYQIPEQIKELNRLVVDFALPKIMTEIEQYVSYLKNMEYLPQPMPLPINVSSAGTKTVRSVASLF